MAIYGRQRSKWDPTRLKAKTSKNRTYEMKRTSPYQLDLMNMTWLQLTAENDSLKVVQAEKNGPQPTTLGTFIDNGGWTYQSDNVILDIPDSRFGKAFLFDGRSSTTTMQNRQVIYQPTDNTKLWSPRMLLDASGEYRNIYISFWIKFDNFGSDMCIAHWAHQGGTLHEQTDETKPLLSITATQDGRIALRLTETNFGNAADVSPGVEYDTAIQPVLGAPLQLEVTAANRLQTNKWYYITFNPYFTPAGFNENQFINQTRVWINGHRAMSVSGTRSDAANPGTFTMSNWADKDFEWQFGDLINGWGTYDSSGNSGNGSIKRSNGFAGALGEFTVVTQYTGPQNDRDGFARFLYEAHTDGVHRLASGAHQSSPRLEQLDQDKDSKHPSSYGLNLITRPDVLGDHSEYFVRTDGLPTTNQNVLTAINRGHDGTLLKDQISIIEGHGKLEDFSHVPSKEFLRYHPSDQTAIMPHLGLHPSDRLITSGSWYDTSRSEIFPEDANTTDGFITKYTIQGNTVVTPEQVPDGRIYKSNQNLPDNTPFHDIKIPEEFDDCYVIEIPLPNALDRELSTDLDGGPNDDAEEAFIQTSLERLEWDKMVINVSADITQTGMYDYFSSGSESVAIDTALTEFYQWYIKLLGTVSKSFIASDPRDQSQGGWNQYNATASWNYPHQTESDRTNLNDGFWDEREAQFNTNVPAFPLSTYINFHDASYTTPLNGTHARGRSYQLRNAVIFSDGDSQATSASPLSSAIVHLNDCSSRLDLYWGVTIRWNPLPSSPLPPSHVTRSAIQNAVLRDPSDSSNQTGVNVHIVFAPKYTSGGTGQVLLPNWLANKQSALSGARGTQVTSNFKFISTASDYVIVIEKESTDTMQTMRSKFIAAVNGEDDGFWNSYGNGKIYYFCPTGAPAGIMNQITGIPGVAAKRGSIWETNVYPNGLSDHLETVSLSSGIVGEDPYTVPYVANLDHNDLKTALGFTSDGTLYEWTDSNGTTGYGTGFSGPQSTWIAWHTDAFTNNAATAPQRYLLNSQVSSTGVNWNRVHAHSSSSSDITEFDLTPLTEFYNGLVRFTSPAQGYIGSINSSYNLATPAASALHWWNPPVHGFQGGVGFAWNPSYNPYDQINGQRGFTGPKYPSDRNATSNNEYSFYHRRQEVGRLPQEVHAAVIATEKARTGGLLTGQSLQSPNSGGGFATVANPSDWTSNRIPSAQGNVVNVNMSFTIALNEQNKQLLSNSLGGDVASAAEIAQNIVKLFNTRRDSYNVTDTYDNVSPDIDLGTDIGRYNVLLSNTSNPQSYAPIVDNASKSLSSFYVVLNNPTIEPTGQQIRTMAYYNFKRKRWEWVLDKPWNTDSTSPDDVDWVRDCDIGFTPMSGIIIPTNQEDLERSIQLYGRPTSDFGFPYMKKFESDEGQTIDLSQYIHEPVVLKGWELKQDVVPRVGYQHRDNDGTHRDTNDSTNITYMSCGSIDDEIYYPGALALKSPFYYGAHGEAAVYYDSDNEIGPFREYYNSVSNTYPSTANNDRFEYNRTVPVRGGEEDIEAQPPRSAEGLITKGVTAFLLRERDLVNETIVQSNFFESDHKSSLVGNIIHRNNSGTLIYDVNLGLTSPTLFNSIGNSAAQSELDFEYGQVDSNGDNQWFGSKTSRDILGYLQCIYHNEPSVNPDKPREYWYRSNTVSDESVVRPRYIDTPDLISLLDREQNVFVGGYGRKKLLRQNLDELYPFHVSGSMKLTNPLTSGYPISAFRIKANANNELGVYDSTQSVPELRQPYHAQSIFPTDFGRPSSSSLISERSVSSVSGVSEPTTTVVPNALYPIGGNTVLPNHTSEITISKSDNSDCEVILAPTDRLILGIQDSISTTIGSQQCFGGTNTTKFIRWGRNRLLIPESQHGAYLRLFVQKQRVAEPIPNRSNQTKEFSDSVHREIGDIIVDDQYIVEPVIAYSGSLGDDIIGPIDGVQTIPTMELRFSSFTYTQSTEKALDDGSEFWDEWNYYRNTKSSITDWQAEVVSTNGRSTTWNGKVPYNAASIRTSWYVPSHRGKPSTMDDNIDEPTNVRGNNFGLPGIFQWHVRTDYSGVYPELGHRLPSEGVALSELNPRMDAPTYAVEDTASTNLTFGFADNPAISAWNMGMTLPYITNDHPNGSVKLLHIEFRLVKLHGNINARRIDANGAEQLKVLAAGDAFYFEKNSNLPVWLDTTITSASHIEQRFRMRFKNDGSIPTVSHAVQGGNSFYKHFTETGLSNSSFDVVYIVAAKGADLDASSTYLTQASNNNNFQTWADVRNIIFNVLQLQIEVNPGIIAAIKQDFSGGYIQVSCDDKVLETEISDAISTFLPAQSRAWWAGENLIIDNGVVRNNTWDNAVHAWGVDTDFTNSAETFDPNTGGYNTARKNFILDFENTIKGSYFWSVPNNVVEIDFTNSPRWGFVRNTTEVSESDASVSAATALIERKVLFRSTVGNASVFGSLQKTKQPVSNAEVFYDSGAPFIQFAGDDVNLHALPSGDPDNANQFYEGWWPENSLFDKKTFENFPRTTSVKLVDSGASSIISNDNDESIQYSLVPNGSVMPISFPDVTGS